MSEAEFLNFKEDEFVVLEDAIEFDEQVQREERVRFYTKDEQEKDAFEKLMPKGKTTQSQREAVRNEILYYSDLYARYIQPTDNDYVLREPVPPSRVSWVSPVYSEAMESIEVEDGTKLDLEINRTALRYYPRMLQSLPRPYEKFKTSDQQVLAVDVPTQFVNKEGEKPIRALPESTIVSTQRNEDKTITILTKKLAGTGDEIPFTGFFVHDRKVNIPNPLPEHPFFANAEPHYIPTDASFQDTFPTIDAIFTHGIPVTPYPYTEATPYLRIYDVRLSEVPWSLWKLRFPPAPLETDLRERTEIPVPAPEGYSVSTNIQEFYGSAQPSGVAARKWMMDRVDGGRLAIQLLLSKASQFGSVESVPGIDLPLPSYPKTTISECKLSDLSFQDFSTKGILRRSWKLGKKDGKDIDIIDLTCVPMEFVQQERARVGYANRMPWKEDTESRIKEKYIRLLKRYVAFAPRQETETKLPRTPVKEQSRLRTEVLSVINDPNRDRGDKYRDVKTLLDTALYGNSTYTDAEGLFVLCGHSLEALTKLIDKAYYDTWGVKESGFYVCKVCGQYIDNVELNTEDDFDDAGLVIRHAESLTAQGEGTSLRSTYLEKVRPLFTLDDPGQSVLLLLLGLLQVEPSIEILTTILNSLSEASKGISTAKETGKFLRSILGLVATALLLQIHVPYLVPRRSFGPRPLKLSGFPRDTKSTEGETIFDSLLLAIRKTFELFPTSVSDTYKMFVSEVLKDSKRVRTISIDSLEKFFLSKQPELRKALDEARSSAPVPLETPSTLPEVRPPPKDMTSVKGYTPCKTSSVVFQGKRLPKIRQEEVPLRNGIHASMFHTDVRKPVSIRVEPVVVLKDEIRALKSRKDAIKGTALEGKIGDSVQTNLAIASRLADMYRLPQPIRSANPDQSAAELRDYARGLVNSLVMAILAIPKYARDFNERVKGDITLMSLVSKLDAEKKEVRRVSANERLEYVKRNALLTDIERDINTQLVKIGLGPVLITLEERDLLAKRQEEEDEMPDLERDVGLPQHDGLDEGVPAPNADGGDYGDLPGRLAGRDPEPNWFAADRERGI